MLSKNKSQFIKSLRLKKNRQEQGCFVVEGKKGVLELMGSDFEVRTLVCTEEFWRENEKVLAKKRVERILCSDRELESVSGLETANAALAVAGMKPEAPLMKLSGLVLALDGISDPGNLGALIRTADWFGVGQMVASPGTVDFYNPKVLQASMGGFCRVAVHYTPLEKFLSGAGVPVYAASMEGKSAHNFPFKRDCVLLLGSESRGISRSLLPFVVQTVAVPAYGKAESLNVAAAAAVLCDNIRRLTK